MRPLSTPNSHHCDACNGWYWATPEVILTRIPRTATTSQKAAYRVGRSVNRKQAKASDKPLVAFVRHPLDRLVSAYSGIWLVKKDDIDRFVDRMVAEDPETVDKHIRPQHTFLYQSPVFVGHYENLAKDWDEVRAVYCRDFGQLPHLNGSNHRPWQEVLKGDTLFKAIDYYAKDFEMFGYDR